MPWKLSHGALGHTALNANRPPVPLGHSRDRQHEPSRTDRTESAPMWPCVPGEYSRREDVGLAPESAKCRCLLPGSKGSAYEASSLFSLGRQCLTPKGVLEKGV